jgi:hypothetical protein
MPPKVRIIGAGRHHVQSQMAGPMGPSRSVDGVGARRARVGAGSEGIAPRMQAP